jgi:hypothetical protein
VQYWDGHISTCLIKTLMIYLYCAYCACASYIFVIITRYLFICALLFIIVVHLFCSLFRLFICKLFDFIFLQFFAFIYCSLSKREKCNSDPELCSGILILLPVQHHLYASINIIQQAPVCSGILIPLPVQHHLYASINIIQQTPPTLS